MRPAPLVVVLTAVMVFALAISGVARADDAPPAQPVASIAVTGDVRNPASVTLDDLRAFPPQVRSVTFASGTGSQRHNYVGALLDDVVTEADPAIDASAENPMLAVVILATGADGYGAAVAWAEVSPDFTDMPVLLAHTEDGEPLDRPRLVVPGDARGGRYVRDLTELRIVNLRG